MANDRLNFDKKVNAAAEQKATTRIQKYEKETEADRTAAKNDREAAAEELKQAREDAAKIRETRQKEWLPYAKKAIFVIGCLFVAVIYFTWQGVKLEIANFNSNIQIGVRERKAFFNVAGRVVQVPHYKKYIKDLVNAGYEEKPLDEDAWAALDRDISKFRPQPPEQQTQPTQQTQPKPKPKKQPKKQKKKTEKASASEQVAIEQLEQKQEPQEKSEAEEVMDKQDRAWQEALKLRDDGWTQQEVKRYLMEKYGFTFGYIP